MGIQLASLVKKEEIELQDLVGKKIGIDAYNWIYQFLSMIRDRETGEPLKDSRGRITSHLSGVLYRTAKLVESGIKPIWVFDGEPFKLKQETIERRKKIREEAKEKWKIALEKGDVEGVRKASQAATKLTDEMVEQSKKLLELMGIPFIQAPSEGEAQCAYLCKKNIIFATASQDYDALLFGSPILIRNLSVTGRRKIPGRNEYIQIKPEIIELKKVLSEIGINQKQLILIGLLMGTDYNSGVKGVGPKTALKIVIKEKKLENILNDFELKDKIEDIYNFFLKPPVLERPDIKFVKPNREELIKFLVDEFEFSHERIEKVVSTLEKVQQSSLEKWFT